ncbi:ATP-binding cassette domain-containing protein [Streptomyces sp. NPDC059649]|uniref:ATP-binding cassette domain-containing protein n=1 Tax=Streptomyces sp. NPDC059649 TaxID=3346895 RepID=UPI0036A4C6C1
MPLAIRAERLVKDFGDVRAVDGIDLDVAQGGVLGLLGPNGSGKSTVVRMITTLLKPTAGQVTVLGADVAKEPDKVRRLLGVCGQFAAVDGLLAGRENLQRVGQRHRLRKRDAAARAQELLELFDLAGAADRPADTYSGGMRRRLDLAAAVVIQPPVMVLDEPTTGLDPVSRLTLWQIVRELVQGGTTLLLSTQYLEEADQLANDICVIDHGRVLARGTSDQLKEQSGKEQVEVVVRRSEDIAGASMLLCTFGCGDVTVEEHLRRLTVPVTGGAGLLGDVIRRLEDLDVAIDDIGLRRPTLDDVFVALTGQSAELDEQEQPEPGTAAKESVK